MIVMEASLKRPPMPETLVLIPLGASRVGPITCGS